MANKFKYDVIQRWQGNPLLTIEDIPFPCNTVFNAACAKYKGQYILLLRVEDLTGRSVFALARSDDGYHFELEPEPVMTPCNYIMYTAVSPYGPLLALAKTTDFKNFERIALISEPENKDGALFPEKINGKYARFDRPVAG
ncbi:MAG: glycoside hydrolase family 130 protein, partial [Planctomycetota bacterium]